ncbi:hypothetical protein HLB15_17195, partial [Promicromonospora citrea]
MVVSELSTRLAAAVRAARAAAGRGLPQDAAQDVPRDDAAWPTTLLDPARELVPFLGRERELAELTGWAETDAPTRLRLVVAPAGYGKTRLAQEFGRRMAAAGWAVVPVARGKEAAAARTRPPGDVLFVVDHAATRLGLPAMLDGLARPARGRTRVLLLARVAGEWLRRLRWSSSLWDGLDRDDATQTALDLRLDPQVPDAVVLDTAVSAFARHLGAPDPGVAAVRLTDPAGGSRVSDLHAGAALAVLAAAGAPV